MCVCVCVCVRVCVRVCVVMGWGAVRCDVMLCVWGCMGGGGMGSGIPLRLFILPASKDLMEIYIL